jgi:hypothetical protein
MLSDREEMDLILGPAVGAFKSDEERRRAWFQYRDGILNLVPNAQALAQYEHKGERIPNDIHTRGHS